MVEFILIHAEALYVRLCAIYGDKFFKPYHTDEFKKIWHEEWVSGLNGIDVMLIKGALEYCKANIDWPPSIGEFRRICEKSSGMPTMAETMAAAVRREFSHPIVAMAFDKVGSWAMKNDKEAELRVKFQAAYDEALNQFRVNPEAGWKQLEDLNARAALPPPLPKIPSAEECLGFKERLRLYMDKSMAEKLRLGDKSHPEWPEKEVKPGCKSFNPQMHEERKKYLMELDELLAGTLSMNDQYDRIRLLRELEGQRYLESLKGSYNPREEKKSSHRTYNSPKTVFRTAMGD